MKNKGMVIVAIAATLLLPLATPAGAGSPSSHDGVEAEKLTLGADSHGVDQEMAAADLSGLPLAPRALILLALLVVTGAGTTDVVSGEVKRRRIRRARPVRHAGVSS